MESLKSKTDQVRRGAESESYARMGLSADGSFDEVPEDVRKVVTLIEDSKLQTKVVELIEEQIRKAVDETLSSAVGDGEGTTILRSARIIKN